jgi:tetratricopeptide (TPR) repeat protein
MWEEAINLAEAGRHVYGLAWVHWAADRGFRIQGDGVAAAHRAQSCLDIAVREGFTSFADTSTAGLGHALALSGRPGEGARLLQLAIERLASRGQQVQLPNILADLSEAHLLGGQIADALTRAQEALDLSRKHHAGGVEAIALRLCGEARADQGSPNAPRAEADLRAALTIAEELGMRPLVAHCHLGFGKLYRRTGKRQEAQEHLTTATTMYREMDMRFWLEQSEAEVKSLG